MKFGFRVPSLKKRISARLSVKRIARHSLGLKAPKGMGIFTNPKKALYNKVYQRTTFGIENLAGGTKHVSSSPASSVAANVRPILKNKEPRQKKNLVIAVALASAIWWAIGMFLGGTESMNITTWTVVWIVVLMVVVLVWWHSTDANVKFAVALQESDRQFSKGNVQSAIDLLLPYADVESLDVAQRLGYRYSLLAKYSDAEKYLQSAFTANPNNLEMIYPYAVTLFNLKKYEESLKVLAVLSIEMQSEPMFANILGGNYHGMGKDDVAIEIFKKCISRKQNLQDEEMGIALNLGKILLAQGNKAEAKKYVLKLLAVNPTHAQGMELLAQL